MTLLILGVVLFALAHAVPANRAFRARLARSVGEGAVKGLVALLALAGVAAMVWGYGAARFEGPEALWDPPIWTQHLAALLVLVAFVIIAAAYTPPGVIKHALKHPMLAGVKVWALAHLLANGTLPDVILFGGLLAWAVAARIAISRRERAAGIPRPPCGPAVNDLFAIAAGGALWAVFVYGAHEWLFGVSPLGM